MGVFPRVYIRCEKSRQTHIVTLCPPFFANWPRSSSRGASAAGQRRRGDLHAAEESERQEERAILLPEYVRSTRTRHLHRCSVGVDVGQL